MSEPEEQSQLLKEIKELAPLPARFVVPIYLKLLHGNFAHPSPLRNDDPAAVRELISSAAKGISDEELWQLLRSREWRGRLTAGWLIGISKSTLFINELGQLLLASSQAYSGQGYCVALGLISQDACRTHLVNYLSEYLPLRGRIYDQQWAIGALSHVDETAVQPFLNPELWNADGKGNLNPERGIRNFKSIVDYLIENGMIAA